MAGAVIDGLRFLLAARCRLCGTVAPGGLCRDCSEALPWNRMACRACAQPMPVPQSLCARCQRRPPRFDGAAACLRLEPPVQQWIHGLKSRARLDAAALLARLMAERAPPFLRNDSLLLPVPLHPHRLRRRGYNQSLELARRLARHTGLRVDAFAIEQRRPTRDLTQLSRAARRREVRGAFAARAERVAGQALVLVDDVLTTGATAEAIAHACRQAGAASLHVWAAARTP